MTLGSQSKWIWPFELLDKLGEGGMGVVYRARYVGNDRIVAVKLVPPEVSENTTLLARFEREIDVLKQLKHPNIVHCFGGTCESQQRFYAMEVIDGGTLADLLRQKGRLSWDRVIDLGIQMCAGLQFAHERGVIHRDIKPGNFLLTKSGKVKLSDFGLATVTAANRLTAAGKTLGTFLYMAPEQIRGKPPLSNRTDLYALGCVFYELLTGHPPFEDEAVAAILQKHLKEPCPRVSAEMLDCPVELDRLVASLLEKDPQNRPADANEVARRLEAILQPSKATFPPSPGDFLKAPPPAAETITPRVVTAALSESDVEISVPPPSTKSRDLGWAMVCLGLVALAVVTARGWQTEANRHQADAKLWQSLLGHPSAEVRASTVLTLAQASSWSAETASNVRLLCEDPAPAVRQAAFIAFAQQPSAGVPYQASFRQLLREDDSPEVRQQIDQTLAILAKTPSPTRAFWMSLLIPTLILGGIGVLFWQLRHQVFSWAKRLKQFAQNWADNS